MSAFDFINHESFPEDQYIAEAVTLCFDRKYRVTYVRKKKQDGGLYWATISASVKHHGDKKFLNSFSQDSNFLQDDIKAFLEGRQWEKRGDTQASGGSGAQKGDEEVPF